MATAAVPATWPALPARAAYLVLGNAARRNALSRAELQSLRRQLIDYNTSSKTGRQLLLPAFKADLLPDLEAALAPSSTSSSASPPSSTATGSSHDLSWLTTATEWRHHRSSLPSVLVLRSSGPVFSAGHDLAEMSSISLDSARDVFALCAEVMSLLRRSPIPIVSVVQGLATAAGAQLALSADIVIAKESTVFKLPGATLGLPCSSPSTIVSRRLGPGLGYKMLATAEGIPAKDLPRSSNVVVVPDGDDLEERVNDLVTRLASCPPRPQALAKWAYWTQLGLRQEGDGYEEACHFTGRIMALHTQSEEAREGMVAFVEKRKPQWRL